MTELSAYEKGRFTTPRWWPRWLLLGALWFLMQLPLPLLTFLGRGLGRMFGLFASSRRRIIRINLRMCFPELDDAAIRDRMNRHFEAIGRGVFETLAAWFVPDWRLRKYLRLHGLENLEAARRDGSGILLLSGHFTTMEIASRSLCLDGLEYYAMYRPANDPFFEYWTKRRREYFLHRPALSKENLRGLLRALRSGEVVWYGPDQTLEAPNSVFVPFFGVPTLTLTATAKLSTLGRARVVPFFCKKVGNRYEVSIQPALENFPTGDDVADATRINQVIEEAILRTPDEYFWIHRKFKYRPAGMPAVYENHL